MDSDIFTELERSARKLNQLSDSIDQTINRQISEAEKRLMSMRIDVEVFLQEPLEAGNGTRFQLGYGKGPGQMERDIGEWHLLLRREDSASDHEALLYASRDLRSLALQHLTELLTALKIQVDRRIEAIQNSPMVSSTEHRPSLHLIIQSGRKPEPSIAQKDTEDDSSQNKPATPRVRCAICMKREASCHCDCGASLCDYCCQTIHESKQAEVDRWCREERMLAETRQWGVHEDHPCDEPG